MNETNNVRRDYDEVCKKVLANKQILAWIMKCCLDEYRDASIEDITNKYICGKPEISSEEVYPDETAIYSNINELNNEDSTLLDGTIKYDIKYKATVPNTNHKVQLIINVEAQGNRNTPYSLLSRAIYYASRLISSQKNVEFTGSNYDGIKKVYSIWILTTPYQTMPSSITEYHITEKCKLGDYKEDKEIYDLIDIIMIRLGNDKQEEKLIKLLELLFTDKLQENLSLSKNSILKNEYGVDIEKNLRKELDSMCNFSQVVEERGVLKGIELGKEQAVMEVAKTMLAQGLDKDIIAKSTGLSMVEIDKL